MAPPDELIQWLDCDSCSRKTRHKVHHCVDNSFEDEESFYEATASWSIVQCEGCGTYSFLQTSHRRGIDTDGDEATFIDKVLYPRRVVGRVDLEGIRFLPFQIQRIYFETREAICNEMNVLAGVGIRALVEVVCKERNGLGGNLQQKIDGLVEIGDLTAAGAKILHSLRVMGNEAAHEVKAHSSQDLATAFDVIEHLLTGIWILPAKASRLSK